MSSPIGPLIKLHSGNMAVRFFSALLFLSVALAKRSRVSTLPTSSTVPPTTLPTLSSTTEDQPLDMERDVDSLLNPQLLVTPWNLLSAENGSSLILFDEYLYDRFNKSAKNEGMTSVPMESFNNITVFVNEHFRLLYHFLYDLNNYINNIKYNTKLYGRSFCENPECEVHHVTLPECPTPTPSWNVPLQPNNPSTVQRQTCIPRGRVLVMEPRAENRSNATRFPQAG